MRKAQPSPVEASTWFATAAITHRCPARLVDCSNAHVIWTLIADPEIVVLPPGDGVFAASDLGRHPRPERMVRKCCERSSNRCARLVGDDA